MHRRSCLVMSLLLSATPALGQAPPPLQAIADSPTARGQAQAVARYVCHDRQRGVRVVPVQRGPDEVRPPDIHPGVLAAFFGEVATRCNVTLGYDSVSVQVELMGFSAAASGVPAYAYLRMTTPVTRDGAWMTDLVRGTLVQSAGTWSIGEIAPLGHRLYHVTR